uniref:T-complex protein 1 subunit theta n=1 Tax=Sinocyclocheilus rhinocerous TaxID=307959 RepID=A0A673HRK9_9TELE
MALHVPKAPGFAQMLKDGAKHYSGLEEAVFRNIQACKELAHTTRTAYGPNGMNKMVINHLEKLFVTNDAATILRELEVQHPAAKMIVMASHMQEQEVGDGTNFVLVFAGALLELAEELLRMGLSVSEVISIFPESGNFNVDNVRVCKILGCGLNSSMMLHGMVFKKETEGDITSVKDAKIAVFSCPFDCMVTETKGTVLIKNAEELMNFSKGEEDLMEAQVKSIADSGANVVVTGGKVADMALHYANKYKLMLTAHGISLLLFVDKEDGTISTLVIRGSTDNLMDDIERAIDDGVNTFKVLVRDARLCPGAGATDIELAKHITSYGESCPGLEQYAIKKYAEAFEVLPRALAENSGIKGNELISKLYAAHHEGNKNFGFDIEGEGPAVIDMMEAGILDPYLVKHWGIKLATNAAITVLRVDQIIMAKPAGGPKAPKQQGHWDKDGWDEEPDKFDTHH